MRLDNKQLTHQNIGFQIKEISDGTDPDFFTFTGYASTFGNVDEVGDVIERGAFTESLAVRKPKLLWQHQRDLPIGVIDVAQEDNNGLLISGRLPKNVQLAREAGELLKIGAIDSMSIGFRVKQAEKDQDGIMRLRQVDLYEISWVSMPANTKAVLTSIKSDVCPHCREQFKMDIEEIKKIESKKEFERVLREAGFSNSAATYAAARFHVTKSESSDDVNKEKSDEEAMLLKDIFNNLGHISQKFKK